jgi:hypothetical protein
VLSPSRLEGPGESLIHLLRKFRPTLLAYPLLVLLQGKLLGFLPSNFEELLELLGKGEGVLVVRGLESGLGLVLSCEERVLRWW